VHWAGGEPGCEHERLEATVEGGLACADCGALLEQAESAKTLGTQVRYVVRGRLYGMDFSGEWDRLGPARFTAERMIAQGGRATLTRVTTEELPTNV
jgi:hypothetical protein